MKTPREFDEKFPILNDDSVDRYCRLDFPEGDSRSIKFFISSIEKEAEARTVREILDLVKGNTSVREHDAYDRANYDLIFAIKSYAASRGVELKD